MAIDSAEKRKAISGILLPFIVGVSTLVAPDQEWRQESGWSYPGILASVPASTPIVVILRHETLSVPVHLHEVLSVPTHSHETLSVPVHPHEVLTC